MNSANASNEVSINRIGTIVAQVAGPALAILAVSSVAFFLIEVMYSGPVVARCKWIFALFSFAAVLISRISIEEGHERASMYGFFLGMATLLVASRFMQGNLLILAGILAFIWWIAGRLTWDCTFFDETRDATGQGMIDLAIDRVNRSRNSGSSKDRSSASEEVTHPDLVQPLEDDRQVSKPTGPWDSFVKLFLARRQPNTPGLWAFYFLLMGLPLFGLGQVLMGMRDAMGYRAAAIHFFVYMTSLLCLLMLTSKLGLHRYLQKNNSSVPASIAKRWIVTGTILAITVIGFCYWLPRPTAQYSLASWIPKLTSRNLDPTDASAGNDGQKKSDNNSNMNSGPDSRDDRKSEKGDGEKDGDEDGSTGNSKKSDSGSPTDKKGAKDGGGKSSGEQQSSKGSKKKQSSDSGEQSKTKNNQGENQQKSKSGKGESRKGKSGKSDTQKNDSQKSDSKQSEQGKSKERKGLDSPGQSKRKETQKEKKEKQSGSSGSQKQRSRSQPPKESQENNDQKKEQQQKKNNSSNLFQLIGKFARLLIWLAAAIVLCFFAIKYREQIMPWIRSFLAELADFWNRLWNRKKKEPQANEDSGVSAATPTRPLPGFDQYQNPFATSAAQSWSPERLVQYTFQAFEAWSRDRECPRDPEQTAYEFALNTGKQHKPLADDAINLANLYSQLAYAGGSISRKSAMTLARLWEKLG